MLLSNSPLLYYKIIHGVIIARQINNIHLLHLAGKIIININNQYYEL